MLLAKNNTTIINKVDQNIDAKIANNNTEINKLSNNKVNEVNVKLKLMQMQLLIIASPITDIKQM